MLKVSKKKPLKIGPHEIESRLTFGDIRDAKAHFGIDMGSGATDSPALRIHFDPIAVVDAVWALYNRKLVPLGIDSMDKLEALMDDSDFGEIQNTLISEVDGFFTLSRTTSIKMQEVLSGATAESQE